MRIGELAARTGVTTSRVRFYEKRGLLPPAGRLKNGYRDYDEHAVSVVKFIDRAQGFGFSLAEVSRHLSLPDDVDRKASLQLRLEMKLAQLDVHMRAIQERRGEIVGLIEEVRRLRSS